MSQRWITIALVAALSLLYVSVPVRAAENRNQTALSYVELGKKLFRQGDFDKAIGAYNVALQFAPDLALGYFHRGVTYEAMGKVSNALADYTKAIQLAPDMTTGWYNRGNLRLSDGDFA